MQSRFGRAINRHIGKRGEGKSRRNIHNDAVVLRFQMRDKKRCQKNRHCKVYTDFIDNRLRIRLGSEDDIVLNSCVVDEDVYTGKFAQKPVGKLRAVGLDGQIATMRDKPGKLGCRTFQEINIPRACDDGVPAFMNCFERANPIPKLPPVMSMIFPDFFIGFSSCLNARIAPALRPFDNYKAREEGMKTDFRGTG
jgi:hypothetical protein